MQNLLARPALKPSGYRAIRREAEPFQFIEKRLRLHAGLEESVRPELHHERDAGIVQQNAMHSLNGEVLCALDVHLDEVETRAGREVAVEGNAFDPSAGTLVAAVLVFVVLRREDSVVSEIEAGKVKFQRLVAVGYGLLLTAYIRAMVDLSVLR